MQCLLLFVTLLLLLHASCNARGSPAVCASMQVTERGGDKSNSNNSRSISHAATAPGGMDPSSTAAVPETALLPWSPLLVRAYLTYIRQKYRPGLSPQAQQFLGLYYAALRAAAAAAAAAGAGGPLVSTGGLTPRFLESLLRMTQAHARLMARQTAKLRDAGVLLFLFMLLSTVTILTTILPIFAAFDAAINFLAAVVIALVEDTAGGVVHAVAVVWLLEMALGGRQVAPGPPQKQQQQQLLLLQPDITAADCRRGLLSLYSPSVSKVIRELSSSSSSSSSSLSSCTLQCLIRNEREFLLVQDLLLQTLQVSLPPAPDAAAPNEDTLLIPCASVPNSEQQQQQLQKKTWNTYTVAGTASKTAWTMDCPNWLTEKKLQQQQQPLNLKFSGIRSNKPCRPWAKGHIASVATASPVPSLLDHSCDSQQQIQPGPSSQPQQQQRTRWGLQY